MNKKGFSLVVVLFVSTIILMLCTAITGMSTSEYMMSCYVRDYTQAYYLAEGGIQKALSILKETPGYRPGDNWHALGEGKYKIAIIPNSAENATIIESTGRVKKAETSISVTIYLDIEIDEEKYPEPPHRYVEIRVLSWDYDGPI